jgi:putative DNA primase/helicase
MNFNEIIQLFQAEMLSKGITPPTEIVIDAQLHRFHVDGDKRSSKNGWYIIFNDDIPCGVFGNWRIGGTNVWCVKNQQLMNGLELLAFRKQVEQARVKRDQDRKIQHEKASILAEQLWYLACAAHPNHPYLVQKLIRPFYARQKRDDLILPIIDFFGNFRSLQFISPDMSKNKWFLPNGSIKGAFHSNTR